jgi:23S rRNA (cytidine1920-2'-O)/16S rRNA (cytidine1409-2'-O)-methyltransferase
VKQLLDGRRKTADGGRSFPVSRPPSSVCLIKPQFEAGKEHIGKGGVVRDLKVHRAVLRELLTWCAHEGWYMRGLMASPIKGPAGNVEFLAHLSLPALETSASFEAWIDTALEQARQLT